MLTHRYETGRRADAACEPSRWVVGLTMVGTAGGVGVGAQSVASVAPTFAAVCLLVAGLAMLAHGSVRRLQLVSALLALGTVLVVTTSVGTASVAATTIALVGLVAGPQASSRTRRPHRGVQDIASLHELLNSMAIASEIRDHQTADHCDRVSRNCRLLGEFLGLTDGDNSKLEWAARVHDVGKAAIPRRILQKPGPLTSLEMDVVKQHSRLGADILVAASDQLSHIAKVVLHHHENWDGTGYPVGLSGTEIPLEARIIAVVDMYEALTSDRPYRAAMTPQDAHHEVVARSGTRFDPDVIAVFDELWRRGKLDTWALRHSGGSGDPKTDHTQAATNAKQLLLTRCEHAQLTSM